jgi:Co/Zn/Cd efflux system component
LLRASQVDYGLLKLGNSCTAHQFGAGWWASSTALQSDSLDSSGDALVYGLSLIMAGRSLRARAGAAMVKGTIQFVFALAVLAAVAHKLIAGTVPLTVPMAIAAVQRWHCCSCTRLSWC